MVLEQLKIDVVVRGPIFPEPVQEAGAIKSIASRASANACPGKSLRINRCGIGSPIIGKLSRSRHAHTKLGHAPERQIDAPTFRQQCGGPGQYSIDPMESKPARPAEHKGIAGGKPKRTRRVAALGSADAKKAAIAERD